MLYVTLTLVAVVFCCVYFSKCSTLLYVMCSYGGNCCYVVLWRKLLLCVLMEEIVAKVANSY